MLKFLSIYLDEFQFSNYYIIYNLVLYFSTLLFSVQGNAFIRFYHIKKDEVESFFGMFNSLIIIIISSLIFLSLIIKGKNLIYILSLIYIVAYGFFINEINVLRIKLQFKKLLILHLLQFIISISLLLFFRNKLNLNLILGIIIFSFLFSFILSSYKRFDKNFSKISLDIFRKNMDLFKYAIPIALIALFNFMLSSLDQYFLKYFGFQNELASYIANYNIAEKSVVIVLSIITLVFVPKIYKKYNNLELDTFKDVFKIVKIFSFISITIIIFLFFFSEYLTIIITSSIYVDFSWIIPLVGIAGLFLGINSLLSEILTVSKKTYLILIAFTISLIINVLINFFFIENYGIYAAIFSSIFSYIFLTFITCILIRREYIKLIK